MPLWIVKLSLAVDNVQLGATDDLGTVSLPLYMVSFLPVARHTQDETSGSKFSAAL